MVCIRLTEKQHQLHSILRTSLMGNITNAHAEHLLLAQINDWEIPKDKKGRPAHKVTYAAPVNSSSDESNIENSDKGETLTKIVKSAENKGTPFQMKMIYP